MVVNLGYITTTKIFPGLSWFEIIWLFLEILDRINTSIYVIITLTPINYI